MAVIVAGNGKYQSQCILGCISNREVQRSLLCSVLPFSFIVAAECISCGDRGETCWMLSGVFF